VIRITVFWSRRPLGDVHLSQSETAPALGEIAGLRVGSRYFEG
jgi:hypothetical protein